MVKIFVIILLWMIFSNIAGLNGLTLEVSFKLVYVSGFFYLILTFFDSLPLHEKLNRTPFSI